jgi:hypothetical protein
MPEFGDADEDVDAAQSGNPAAKDVMQDDRTECGNIVEKIIAFPQFRPRNDHKEQADFEAEEDRDDGNQPAHL